MIKMLLLLRGQWRLISCKRGKVVRNKQTSWNTVLENPTVAQLVDKFPTFIDPKSSLPLSKQPATNLTLRQLYSTTERFLTRNWSQERGGPTARAAWLVAMQQCSYERFPLSVAHPVLFSSAQTALNIVGEYCLFLRDLISTWLQGQSLL